MNFEQARFNMVEQQIRTWEVFDQDVLDLLMAVRREDFVPEAYRNLAFADIEVPIGCGQSMLRPVIEAKIMQALKVKRSDSVLEIGAGSGYFAALLAARAEWVRTVDIEPQLVKLAAENLERYGVQNVGVKEADGAHGLPCRAPYDVIVYSGGLPVIPHDVLEQLKVGGRLFAFVGEAPVMKARLVTCVAKGEYRTEDVIETVVPALQNTQQKDGFTF